MKNNTMSFLTLGCLICACSSEPIEMETGPEPSSSKHVEARIADIEPEIINVVPGPGNLAKANVKKVISNGVTSYHSIYGGFDFNLGVSFPYPLTINPYENYTIYIPSIGSVSTLPNQLLEFHMGLDGSAFTAVFFTINGSLPANGYTALHNYYKAFDNFLSQTTDPQTGTPKQATLPDFSTYATGAGYNPAVNGLITIKGRFVKDISSPTNVSIIDMAATPYVGPM